MIFFRAYYFYKSQQGSVMLLRIWMNDTKPIMSIDKNICVEIVVENGIYVCVLSCEAVTVMYIKSTWDVRNDVI